MPRAEIEIDGRFEAVNVFEFRRDGNPKARERTPSFCRVADLINAAQPCFSVKHVPQDTLENGADASGPELVEDEPHDENPQCDAHNSIAGGHQMCGCTEVGEHGEEVSESDLHADGAHVRAAKHPSGEQGNRGRSKYESSDRVGVGEEQGDGGDAEEAADGGADKPIERLLLCGAVRTETVKEHGDDTN